MTLRFAASGYSEALGRTNQLHRFIAAWARQQGCDEVEIRPGQVVRLDVIEHTGAITMLPLDDAHRLLDKCELDLVAPNPDEPS